MADLHDHVEPRCKTRETRCGHPKTCLLHGCQQLQAHQRMSPRTAREVLHNLLPSFETERPTVWAALIVLIADHARLEQEVRK